MILGMSLRKLDNNLLVKERYLKYFCEYEVILLYPGSSRLFNICDAFVIVGGDDINPYLYKEENTHSLDIDDEIDQLDLQIIDYAVRNQKAVLGICRGIQVINVYFGGSLYQDIKMHQSGFHEIYGNISHTLFPDSCLVNSFHHQSIKKLGDDLEVMYCSNDGIVEMIEHRYLPIFAVQFHPEMEVESIMSMKILEYFRRQIAINANS